MTVSVSAFDAMDKGRIAGEGAKEEILLPIRAKP
jgi:hypothetical protein